MSQLHPKSKSTATRTAKALEAAATDLEYAAEGLRNAARCYRERFDTDAGPMNLRSSAVYISMVCQVLRPILQPKPNIRAVIAARRIIAP